MNDLQIFKNKEFGNIRIIEKDGEPWFVGKDIAEALGYERADNAIRNHVEDEDKLTHQISASGQNRNMTIINESGLYSLVLSSKLPSAKQFKRWVTSEVLPIIRKTGTYNHQPVGKELLALAVLEANKVIEDQDKQIKELIPKGVFADSVAASHTTILVGELAKILKQNGVDTGQNRLFQWMRENGYLINRKGTDYSMPTQRSMELGLFEIKETSVAHSDGHITINKTPKVTGKGQIYFINKLKPETAIAVNE